MKKYIIVILFPFLIVLLCSFSYQGSAVKEKSYENTKMKHYIIGINTTVSASLRFKIIDQFTKQEIEGVKLVVINKDGEVIDTLLTDKNGQAEKTISAPLDKKYFSQELNPMQRGTVTLIAYKDGYRETVLFEVPVNPNDTYQPFSMYPVVSGQRNEPVVRIAEIHHLTIIELVDKYR